jgi:Zn-dependent protease
VRAWAKAPTELADLNGTIATICVVAPPIMFAIIAHEVMHGVVALRLGDDTALRAGRLTLNPISHVDLFGTVILPFALYLFSLPVLGYAKPVPVDFRVLRGGRIGMMKVAAAGPLTNFVLAIVSGLALRVMPALLHGAFGATVGVPLVKMLQGSVIVNVELGVFNLFPVLPLDGGRVLFGILPIAAARAFARTERYGFLILLLLLYTHWLDLAIYPVMNMALGAISWMVQL